MDKAYYIITWRPAYLQLLATVGPSIKSADAAPERVLVSISEGGFGEGVVDFLTRVKEKFLEYELSFRGVDLPCTGETFDRYFNLEIPTEVVDLDDT